MSNVPHHIRRRSLRNIALLSIGLLAAYPVYAAVVNSQADIGITINTTKGGTGLSLWTAGDLPYYASGTGLSKLAAASSGNVLLSGTSPAWGKVALASAVSGTLPAANGGTGVASYAIGDLLYASGTTALSKLADVATGSVLLSGGVGTAPAYGKVNLGTMITGTLSGSNVSGGTFGAVDGSALTSLTAANVTGTNTLPAGVLPTTVVKASSSLTSGTIPKAGSSNQISDSILTESSGKIGVGISPTYGLDIAPSSALNQLFRVQPSGTSGYLSFERAGGGTSKMNPLIFGQEDNDGATGSVYSGITFIGVVDQDEATSTAAAINIDGRASGAALVNRNLLTVKSFGNTKVTVGPTGNLTVSGGMNIGGGTTLAKVMSNTASVDFGAITANTCSDSSGITVTGAADGDVATVGVPAALMTATGFPNVTFSAYVSSSSTVKVRACNASAVTTSDPSAATIRVQVNHF